MEYIMIIFMKKESDDMSAHALIEGMKYAAVPATAFVAGAAKLLHDHMPKTILNDVLQEAQTAKIDMLRERLGHIDTATVSVNRWHDLIKAENQVGHLSCMLNVFSKNKMSLKSVGLDSNGVFTQEELMQANKMSAWTANYDFKNTTAGVPFKLDELEAQKAETLEALQALKDKPAAFAVEPAHRMLKIAVITAGVVAVVAFAAGMMKASQEKPDTTLDSGTENRISEGNVQDKEFAIAQPTPN
jgi:hypothetical protein